MQSWCMSITPLHPRKQTPVFLTLGAALGMLGDDASAVLLVHGPLVDVHGRVGRASIQHDPILRETVVHTQRKHTVTVFYNKLHSTQRGN